MKTQIKLIYKWIFFILIVLLNCSSDLFSQKSETNLINKYTTEQGLSSNVIYSILQDNKGLIWVATEEGLNKFDGKNFTVFSVNKGRHSLSHNRTQTLYLAPDGNIWTGTSNGLNIYNYKSDSIIQVTTKTSPLKLVYNDITFITSSFDKNKTWIGTYGNGVNFFNWSKRRFYTLLLPKIHNILPPKNVMSLLEDDNKRLWIGTRHNGLYRYDLQSKKLEIYNLPDNSQFIRVIYQDSYRRIWIGTSKGCYLYNETTNQVELINYPAELKTTFIGIIKEDRSGKIWIGTESSLMNFSVRSFSLTEKFMYQVINHGESVSRLNCGSINALYADVDNNIWIGTAWGGVNMLKTTPTKFKLIRHDSEVKYSLPNSPINALCPDRHGNLFVATEGTDKIGVGLMNLQNYEFKVLDIDKRFPNVVYQCMYYDSHDNLWLGTYNNGLIKTNKDGTVYKQYFSDKSNLNTIPGNDIRCIFEAKDGTIWIGTSNGFAKFKSDKQQFERINLHVDMLGIRCVKETEDGTLWLGSYGEGLITYNYRTKKLNMNPVPFKVDIIYDILIHNDNIWVATQGEGLVVFNRRSNKFRFYKEKDGLPTNYLKTLSRDKKGRIWIASTKGLSKLEPQTNEIENFNSQDGLQSREFSERSCAVDLPNGLFAFGGFGGLNIFNPLDVTKNDKCPPVVFTKLLIYNEIITPTENRHNYSPIKENITLTDKIELKYNQSVFTIEFMGIDYNATQKIQYAYILEGSDKRWNHLGTQNSVTFRNLLPGKYVFKVKASSPDAVWNDANIASIVIIVKPPFWLTGWAYLFYLIIFTTLLYFIWSFLTIRIHTANHLKIERAKHEKEEELHQEKLQFFTNISHEFRTPLTLIIGPLEKMQMEETENDKKNQVKLMLRNAKRLLSMVNQLLDFRKAEKGQMKLKVGKLDMIKVVNDTVCLFDELKNQKNISFDFIHDEEQLFAWFDAEFLNKSLFNLLSNAFKFTPDGGRIFIRLEVIKDLLDNNNVEISCTDNGKGIHPNDIQFVFDRFFLGKEQSSLQQGSGIGLHFAKNLIELHHGTIEVISTPNVETTFKITLPIESSAYLKDEFKDETELFPVASLNKPEDNFTIDIDKKLTLKKDTRKRILIVEDNNDIRNYIQSILSMDYIVEDAENGIVALEMLEMNDFDLIVSDLMMPEMDGIELCKRLKSSIETDHIPFIMLTAKADIENRIEGLSIGADSYITKPFHPKHLTVRVSKLIELRDLLKERYSRKISLGELSITENTTSPDELFIQKTISIILSKMIETDFNGDSLSNDLGISRMGLHRKIKALTDQSTGEFIRNIRLKKACELLSIPSKNISEVSYEVGFNSPSYFTTCFTETFKVTPSEYAKNMRNTIS